MFIFGSLNPIDACFRHCVDDRPWPSSYQTLQQFYLSRDKWNHVVLMLQLWCMLFTPNTMHAHDCEITPSEASNPHLPIPKSYGRFKLIDIMFNTKPLPELARCWLLPCNPRICLSFWHVNQIRTFKEKLKLHWFIVIVYFLKCFNSLCKKMMVQMCIRRHLTFVGY